MGKEIKFRPETFYLGIVDMLAREVEGQKDNTDGKQTNDEQEQERQQMVQSLEEAGAQEGTR